MIKWLFTGSVKTSKGRIYPFRKMRLSNKVPFSYSDDPKGGVGDCTAIAPIMKTVVLASFILILSSYIGGSNNNQKNK
jgi:hypothetical protein